MIVRARTEINEELIRDLLAGEKNDLQVPESCFFFNSGSAALRFFLQMNRTRKRVGVQVFTCSTVLDSIFAEGCVPVFLDVDIEYYTSTLDYIKAKINEMDILLLTHLFGIPNPDYLDIKLLCKEHNVVLIDDLCQTYHAKIGDCYLEDLSENYIYSFFYDKPISSLAGGMLKIADNYRIVAEKQYNVFSKIDDLEGRRDLKVLLLMHKLLSPNLYIKEFRCGDAWRRILEIWPLGGSIKVLNFVVNGKWMAILNKLIKVKRRTEIIRLSDVEIYYLLFMMRLFHDNNQKLIDYYRINGMEVPVYLRNPKICCSVAKRALVETVEVYGSVQVGLYNWSQLICNKEDYSSYPNAASIINTHTNIPCWMDGVIRVK